MRLGTGKHGSKARPEVIYLRRGERQTIEPTQKLVFDPTRKWVVIVFAPEYEQVWFMARFGPNVVVRSC
jgi:hypothetical protein